MACLTAVLALMGIYIPVFRIMTDLVWTIPIVIATVRHGLLTGVLSIMTAGLLIFSLSTPLEAIFLVLQFGGLALVYGLAFHKRLHPGLTLIYGSLTAVASILLVLYLAYLIFGANSINMIEQMKAAIDPTIVLYEKIGLFDGQRGITAEVAREMLLAVINRLVYIIPALLALYGLSSAFLNYIIAQKILAKLKIPVPQLPAFRYWHLPWWTVWGFVGAFAANMAGNYWGLEILQRVASNIMFIYGPVLFTLGLAVINFFIHKYLDGGFLYRWMIILFVFLFFQFAMWIIAVIGLADLFFNYRHLPREV